MRKLVIAVVLLAALGFAAPMAQAGPFQLAEMGFKSSVDGTVYDKPYLGWPPAGATLSSGLPGSLPGTWFGTISYTFSGADTYYVAGFFDYQFVDSLEPGGIFDEWATGGLTLPGLSGQVQDSWDPSGSISTNFAAFDASHPFDNINYLPGTTAPNWGDVSVGLGYAFTLASGAPDKTVIFTVGSTEPSANWIKQINGPSGDYVFFSVSTSDAGGPVVPEPGTLTLVGLGIAAAARRLRRRA